jgi:hypothetical protein
MSYPAYVPGVLHTLANHAPAGAGMSHGLEHPELHWQFSIVEQMIHETTHAVLLWRYRPIDLRKSHSSGVRRELACRNDRPRQECVTLAAEYWILRHWGFSGIDAWLTQVVANQPRQVTARRVLHHLKDPEKRRYTVERAHRVMHLIRKFVQNWRRNERRANQRT